MSVEPATFTLGEELYEHHVGDEDCKAGWCGCDGFPKRCVCGGLIHADFGDENMDCDYWLYEACDGCGGEHEEADDA